MIIAFKLLVTPILIFLLTSAARRWGNAVGGLLMGIPLVTGPISFIVTSENGAAFASQAAIGNLAGQASVCVFCLAYSYAARRQSPAVSALLAISAFFVTTLVWSQFTWALFPAFVVLLAMIAGASYVFPRYLAAASRTTPPGWDIPLRMMVATSFVLLLTTCAKTLGPQLSGLVAPFPVFVLILCVFTHVQQGGEAAANLLRGVVSGSMSFALFFLTVGGFVASSLGIGLTYLLATLASVAVSGVVYAAGSLGVYQKNENKAR